jgi:hypothetical protein
MRKAQSDSVSLFDYAALADEASRLAKAKLRAAASDERHSNSRASEASSTGRGVAPQSPGRDSSAGVVFAEAGRTQRKGRVFSEEDFRYKDIASISYERVGRIRIETERRAIETTCSTLIIPTNVRGVLGYGLGLGLTQKQNTRIHIEEYYAACRSGRHKVGKVLDLGFSARWINARRNDSIIHLYAAGTKYDESDFSSIEIVKSCLADYLAKASNFIGDSQPAVPMLGAGRGGVDEDAVFDAIAEAFTGTRYDVTVYWPNPTPAAIERAAEFNENYKE